MTIAETIRRLFRKSIPAEQAPRSDKEKLYADIPRLAATLLQDSAEIWSADPHRIPEAIEKAEKSWALLPTPEAAIQIGVMYDLVNRHRDALALYRNASHLFPEHPRLRHEAGIKLLRHGASQDIRDFFSSVLRIDPNDAFAKFVAELIECYPEWVKILGGHLLERSNQSPPEVLIACPVWGEAFADKFVGFLCSSLLAPNNLPAVAKTHNVRLAIFTTFDIEQRLRKEALFKDLLQYAHVSFVNYPTRWTDYRQVMQKHYGPELGRQYSNNCKFLLLSPSHYAALAAASKSGALVIPIVADVLLTNGALSEMLTRLNGAIDVIAMVPYSIEKTTGEPKIERHRDADGRLIISADEFSDLVIEHVTPEYFIDSDQFSSFPVNLCWRSGSELVVHATHYHAICVRPSNLVGPFELTIDPVDSRFLDKHLTHLRHIHFVRDAGIAALGVGEPEPQHASAAGQNYFSQKEMARWLWQVWGPWRQAMFEVPICFHRDQSIDSNSRLVGEAKQIARNILDETSKLELSNQKLNSWRI